MASHRSSLRLWLLAASLAAVGCRTTPAPVPVPARDLAPCPADSFQRDWTRFPAVIALDAFRGPLYVVGDVHGRLAEFQESLTRAGLITGTGATLSWTGETALLVQIGDLVNKGPDSLAAIDFVQVLEPLAEAAGGRVIVLAGNHEIGTLAKGHQRFYAPLHVEAAARGLDFCQDVVAATSRYGTWLRTRPAAVLFSGVYLSHSGNSQGRTRAQVESLYRELVDTSDWGSRQGCGDAQARPPIAGFFNADVWWGPKGERFLEGAKALGVKQFLFGNDPYAFKARGELVGYFGDADGRALIKLDVGTVYGDSRGAILRCTAWREGGGCAHFERLVNPPHPTDPATFEPLPIHAAPPEQPEPKVTPWGC